MPRKRKNSRANKPLIPEPTYGPTAEQVKKMFRGPKPRTKAGRAARQWLEAILVHGEGGSRVGDGPLVGTEYVEGKGRCLLSLEYWWYVATVEWDGEEGCYRAAARWKLTLCNLLYENTKPLTEPPVLKFQAKTREELVQTFQALVDAIPREARYQKPAEGDSDHDSR